MSLMELIVAIHEATERFERKFEFLKLLGQHKLKFHCG